MGRARGHSVDVTTVFMNVVGAHPSSFDRWSAIRTLAAYFSVARNPKTVNRAANSVIGQPTVRANSPPLLS